jgi:hypothetical protein
VPSFFSSGWSSRSSLDITVYLVLTVEVLPAK